MGGWGGVEGVSGQRALIGGLPNRNEACHTRRCCSAAFTLNPRTLTGARLPGWICGTRRGPRLQPWRSIPTTSMHAHIHTRTHRASRSSPATSEIYLKFEPKDL